MSWQEDAALFQFSLLSVVNDNVQLHSSVKKMQGWGFVYLPSLLYHPYLVCIIFGIPSLHLFTFLFSCIYNVELLSCSAMQPVSPLPLTLHPPHPFHLVCFKTPVWVIAAACCSIWRRFEGLNKAAKLGRKNNR